MKTITKKILIISVCLMLAGGMLTALGLVLGGYPGVLIGRNGVTSVNHDFDSYDMKKTRIEDFQNLNIRIDSGADIQILPSDDDNCYLEYDLPGDNSEPEYAIENDTLTFTQKSSANSLVNIGTVGIFVSGSHSTLDTYHITLRLPKSYPLKEVHIYNGYGDVSIENLLCDSMELTLESGDLNLNMVAASALTLSNEYGESNIENLTCDSAALTMESGDLELDTADIHTLTLTSKYGNVTLKDFSGDTAEFTMESGDLELDIVTLSNLTCDSEYGAILLLLPEKLDAYTIHAETEYGQIHIPSDASYTYYSSEDFEAVYRTEGTTDKSIHLTAESGDIEFRTK